MPKNIGISNVIWSASSASMYFLGGTLDETLGHDSIVWLPALVHGSQGLIVLCLGKNPVYTASAETAPASNATPASGATPHPVEPAALRQPISPHMCMGPAVGALSLSLAPGVPNASVYTVTALLAFGLAGLVRLRVGWSG